MLYENETLFPKKKLGKLIESNKDFLHFLNENRNTLMLPLKKWNELLVKKLIIDEEKAQDPFTKAVFVEVLGYTKKEDAFPWTCEREYKVFEGKSADVAFGFFEKGENENKSVLAVGE